MHSSFLSGRSSVASSVVYLDFQWVVCCWAVHPEQSWLVSQTLQLHLADIEDNSHLPHTKLASDTSGE